jgi:hypothetical protein
VQHAGRSNALRLAANQRDPDCRETDGFEDMGEHTNGRLSNVMLMTTFAVMGACAIVLFVSLR